MNRPEENWVLQLQLDAAGGEPLFLQISRAITGDIKRGRLRAGMRLPGSRTLAESLAVHRNTVIAAYGELAAEGWIESSPASGTFVAHSLPIVRPRSLTGPAPGSATRPSRLGFELSSAAPYVESRPPAEALLMSGGAADMRLAPVTELARAYRRALMQHGRQVLDYGGSQGNGRLRMAIAGMLTASRGLATDADDVVITNGSQMALDLLSRALIEPGDVVAVEAFGYRYAWEAFKQHGATVLPMPVDENGLDVAALAEAAERGRVRAVYVTPQHQYPTMVTMTASRRVALLELARRTRMAVIEDDYDHEFHYEGRPVLPLASADANGVVVYIGTLSKILAPGVRLGYVVAPRPLLERIAAHRVYLDRQGDNAVQLAVSQLLEDGTLQRHARRARRVCLARRDHLVSALRRHLPDTVSFRVPSGGMALWTAVSARVDCERWAARALEKKVSVSTAKRYAFDGRSHPFVRLGFASLDERELTDAVARLKEALPSK